MRIDGLVRRSRGSDERHTAHTHPMAGTPCDVPLPSTVTLRLNNALSTRRVGRLNEAEAKLEQDLLENLAFFCR